MLTVINACTSAIDDINVALGEILTPIQGKQLLKNSVGIVGCHYDYVEQGVIQALREALSFDIVGCSVFGSAINGSGGMDHLTLTVLTSDDMNFSTVLTETISQEDFECPIEESYVSARNALGQDPSLIFMFAPINSVSGDLMLEKVNQLSGGTPIFGTLANDVSAGMEKSYLFKNGEYHRDKIAMILIGGEVHPRFYVTAIDQNNIQPNDAVVTGTEGYRITSINHLPVLEYFDSVGVVPTTLAANTMTPLVVDFNDGAKPVVYSMYEISEEGIVCAVMIPMGAKITFAEIDMSGIIETTEITLQQALDEVEKDGANGIIAIPCVTRSLALSPNVDAEIVRSLTLVGDKVPFTLIYSGGEMCPVYNKQHQFINRFHNMTYTLMVF